MLDCVIHLSISTDASLDFMDIEYATSIKGLALLMLSVLIIGLISTLLFPFYD